MRNKTLMTLSLTLLICACSSEEEMSDMDRELSKILKPTEEDRAADYRAARYEPNTDW